MKFVKGVSEKWLFQQTNDMGSLMKMPDAKRT